MGWTRRPSQSAGKAAVRRFRSKVLRSLDSEIAALGEAAECRTDGHAFDALIAAYTGWLAPGGLDSPTASFNAASGWIWVPRGG